MTAPLSEQEIAEGIAQWEQVDPAPGFNWLCKNGDRIFATIRADRARIAELGREIVLAEETTGQLRRELGVRMEQLAERTRERDEALDRIDNPMSGLTRGISVWRTRAESAERQMEKMRDRLFERGAMALAPCFACGYNGPNYFQPDVHPCAARHHAAIAQQEGGE